jgi:2-amino-4-hydroxy-6-hydroxymethyldihydropteridine diphosphokinase
MPVGQVRGCGCCSHTVYFSLGSNLGDKKQNLSTAIELMEEQIGVLVRQSAFLATEPWGFQSDNSFVNAAICMETELDPFEVLERTQKIEREMGRTIKSTNGEYHDRIIDIDILLYDDLHINTPELTIPHPLMEQRNFVMIPMREILHFQ